MVGCLAGLVLEAWWPGVGNSGFRMATVRVLLWRVHSVLGDQVGVWALLKNVVLIYTTGMTLLESQHSLVDTGKPRKTML